MKTTENNRLINYCVIAAFVIIAAYNLWPLFPGKGVIHKGNAVAYCLIYYGLWERFNKWFLLAIFTLTLSNLLDEFFFDPLAFSVYEYLFAAITTLLIYWMKKK